MKIDLEDELETARILAGAKMERLCNEDKHIEACIFQSIRDSLAQNIRLLKTYKALKSYEECAVEGEEK